MTTMYNSAILEQHEYLDITLMKSFLGKSESTVRRLMKLQRLPQPFSWNGKYLWKAETIKRFYSSLERQQSRSGL